MRLCVGVFCVGTLLLPWPSPAEAQRRNPPAAKREDTFLNGPPFTLEQLENLVRGGAVPARRLREAVQNRGVDFPMAAGNAARLKAAGASDDLLELVRAHSPKPPEPPPPPKPARISVKCGPPECEVSLNGGQFVSSQGGVFEVPQIPAGKVVIDFRKEGFTTAQRVMVLDPGATGTDSVTLSPDPVEREKFGAGIWQAVLQSLGGEDALKAAATMEGLGTVTLPSTNGAERWNVLLRIIPGKALFQLRAAKVFHEILFEGTSYSVSKSLKGEEAVRLAADLGAIRESLLPTLLNRLKTRKYRLVSATRVPQPSEEFAVRAESPAETISIGLDAAYQPVKAKIETPTGLGSRLVVYSGYAKHGAVDFPSELQVKALSAPSAALVHFDSLTLKAPLKETDFVLRGKPLPGLK